LVILMLVFAGSGPVGSLFVANIGGAPAPAEDDDNVETTKTAVQFVQVQQHPRRSLFRRPASLRPPTLACASSPVANPLNASTAFLAVGRSRLTC
jgi:hypothetical protein